MSKNVAVYNIKEAYQKYPKITRKNIREILKWAATQENLPTVSEYDAIHFFHSCFYDMEQTKKTITDYFYVRIHNQNIFGNLNPKTENFQKSCDIVLNSVMPRRTKEGDAIFLTTFIDSTVSKYVLCDQMRNFFMAMHLDLLRNGPANGYIVLVDLGTCQIGHLRKANLFSIRTYIHYMQDCAPIRLKAIHYLNCVPWVDKIIACFKPFMKKELASMQHFHCTMEDFSKSVPLEYLPSDFGGSEMSVKELSERDKSDFVQYAEYFIAEDKMLKNELEKYKNKNRGWFSLIR